MAIKNLVFLRHRSGQYDGTNSTEIMTLLNSADPGNPQWLFESANAQEMVFTDTYATPFVLEVTDWVVVSPVTGYLNKYTNEVYPSFFAEGPELANIHTHS